MAGNSDDDETMLREILGELGGSSQGLGIKQLFQLTLQQLKKFKEDHIDLNKKIEDMKKAMDKDLSNPKALKMIKKAHKEAISMQAASTPKKENAVSPTSGFTGLKLGL